MATLSLFADQTHLPLAEQLRPADFDEVVGQDSVLKANGVLRRMIDAGHYHSMILWGPPGCGKTTLARLLSSHSGYELETLSAVQSGVADLKKVFERATKRLDDGVRTMLFVDEIHRFNRAQQDAFLPVLEDGTVTLIGATTENPSFELNAALLSRCRVVVLSRLSQEALESLLSRCEEHLGQSLPLQDDAREALCAMADGDGRYLLNIAEEVLAANPKDALDTNALVELVHRRAPVYDKHQDSHYNLISALHKSLRGSDVDAALYWFQRMLSGGEDPLYIARRLVRFAVEDIGMADPEALVQSMQAKQAYEYLGSPEGELAIAQSVIYLAMAPKSNAQYAAFKQSRRDAKEHGSLMPPKHILNAPTKLMKQEGYGEGYTYDHDVEDGFSGQDYFPEEMERQRYYQPKERGFEREMMKRQAYWDKLRADKAKEGE
ncbi:MAG: replication-associated recombination protein A [Rickettsiales bacterium]|nr:replication-associated recombination protein A [Rickettsiales bacterium]